MQPKHYCGIFGVSGVEQASMCVFGGLFAIQHRGEESSGIVSSDGQDFFTHKRMGLVLNVFDESALKSLRGHMAIGHNRYSTTGSSELRNAQSLSIECKIGSITLTHNGNLTNTSNLRRSLTERGAAFQTSTDSEIMLLLIAKSEGSIEQAIIQMMDIVEGAYSLVILTKTNSLLCEILMVFDLFVSEKSAMHG